MAVNQSQFVCEYAGELVSGAVEESKEDDTYLLELPGNVIPFR